MGLLNWIEGRLRWLGAAGAADPGALWLRWGRRAHYKQQGLDYLTRSADLGNAEGQLELGLFYAEGGYGPGGKGYALELFRQSAEQGNLEAGYHLAEALRWAGRSEEALAWYQRSAQGGFGPSMFWLVKANEYADGLEQQDLEEAAFWRAGLEGLGTYEPPRRSVLMGQPEDADLDPLVRMMRAARDSAEAWVGQWVHRAWFPVVFWGSLGLAAGCLFVGFVFIFFNSDIFGALFSIPIIVGVLFGLRLWWGLRRGSRYSKRQHGIWVKAFKGDPESCFRYGLALKQGTSDVPKDPGEARTWFERAARQGHLEAMVQLAELLRWGAGGLRLPGEARAWLQKAADAGHPGAAEQLKGLPQADT